MRNWTKRVGVASAGALTVWLAVLAPAPSAALQKDKKTPAEVAELRLQKAWQAHLTGKAPAVPLDLVPQPQVLEFAQKAKTPYTDPPEVRSQNGALTTTLTVAKSHLTIGNDKVFLRTYNERLVGPTFRVKPGDTLKITLKNTLPPDPDHGVPNTLHAFNTTNLHTHGLHVSPSGNSDNVLLAVEPGKTQDYEIKIPAAHPAGTYWYHAHHHGSVAAQVGSGMSGAIVIEGGEDAVPAVAAAQERVLVLQQIPYFKTKDMPEGLIEPEYQDAIFGPGTWAKMDRFTTVNGLELPVISARPGAVERWRLIDTGVRETIHLRLMKVENGKLGEALPLHVIANDGISLGAAENHSTVELWPGYRADVLVHAPGARGEYLIVDEEAPAARTVAGKKKTRAFIGRFVVEGEAKPMKLPAPGALAKYRPKSIAPGDVTGKQSASYGVLMQADGKFAFTIDGRSYDPTKPRVLKLGDVDEWTLKSFNNAAPEGAPPSPISVTHPFHIHVNPFEVFSAVDDKGAEHVKTPVWKDTLAIPGGWTLKFRTRYTDFTGDFVQHCHILDHEDQGMMQLVRIVDPKKPNGKAPRPAGAFELPDAAGKLHTLAAVRDKPAVVVFSRGFGCAHCSEQVAAFAEKAEAFRTRGTEVVFITTDTVKELAKAQARKSLPFLILSDPEGGAFRTYGCHDKEPLHGTYVIDAAGRIRWETTGAAPFLDVAAVLREVDRSAARK